MKRFCPAGGGASGSKENKADIRRDAEAAEVILAHPEGISSGDNVDRASHNSRDVDGQGRTNSMNSMDRNKPQKVGRGGFPNPAAALYSEGWKQLRKRYRSNGHDPTPKAQQDSAADERAKQARQKAKEKEALFGLNEAAHFGRNSTVRDLDGDGHRRLALLEVGSARY